MVSPCGVVADDIAAASGLRPSAWVASVSGLAGLPVFDFASPDDFVATGTFLPPGGGVFGLTEVAPCAGSTFGVGIFETTRSGDGLVVDFGEAGFFEADFPGAAFFATAFFTGFFVVDFFCAVDDFFTADFFAAAFLRTVADFFDAGMAVFFEAGVDAFFVADFFAIAFFAGAFFADDFFTTGFFAFDVVFFVADFATVAGFFFFFASVATFDATDLLALDDLAFADLPAAFFVAGLAVDVFDFGDGRFMINSSGRWTSLRGVVHSTANHERTTRVLACKTSRRMKQRRFVFDHTTDLGGPFSSIVLPSGSSM